MTSTTKFDFPVKLTPIKTNNILIPKKSAVLRTDTNQPIGVVSDKYALVPHKEVIHSLRGALKGKEYNEKIELTKNGAHLFATYSVPSIKIEIRKGDFANLQFVAKNSYDGRKSFSLMLGAYRLVCSNGMVLGKDFFRFTQKHIESGESIEAPFLAAQISAMVTNFKSMVPLMQGMAETKIDKERRTHLFDSSNVSLPEYLLKVAASEFEKEGDFTKWGYYNSLTYAVSHNMRKDNPKSRINFLQRSWQAVASIK